MFALSFHGFFEGIAVGLAQNYLEMFNLALSIALHKWAEALTLAVSFQKNNLDKRESIYMLLFFACTTPIGTLLGLIISSN